jgi:CubicO group peptidase (beta-lactamase class C family)
MKHYFKMKNIFKISLLIFPLFSAGQNIQQKIDRIVQSKMYEYRITGLSLSVVKDGKAFYSKGYGFTNVDSVNSVTEDTRFPLESVTKLFTTTAIMQLVEKNELQLENKVVDYLPDFKLKDKRFKDIKIIHLITHSSGLPWDWELKEPKTDSNLLQQLIYSLDRAKLKFAPGEKFSGATYSNIGFDLLGYIIQSKTKKPFAESINRILNQIDMNNTTYSVTSIPNNKLALPNILSGNTSEIKKFNLYNTIKDTNPVLKYRQNPIIEYKNYPFWSKPEDYPCGYLYSTATDMSKFICAMLNIYNGKNGNIISTVTLRKMWDLQRSIESKKTSIGIGWWRYTYNNDNDFVFHVGNETGFSTVLRIYPKINEGISILTNAKYAESIVWNELPDLIMKLVNEQ